MKAIIFNGALERKPLSTSGALSDYISGRLKESDVESKIFNLANSGIPLYDTTLKNVPHGVEVMNAMFLEQMFISGLLLFIMGAFREL